MGLEEWGEHGENLSWESAHRCWFHSNNVIYRFGGYAFKHSFPLFRTLWILTNKLLITHNKPMPGPEYDTVVSPSWPTAKPHYGSPTCMFCVRPGYIPRTEIYKKDRFPLIPTTTKDTPTWG